MFNSSLVSTDCAAGGRNAPDWSKCFTHRFMYAGVYNEEVFSSLDWVLAEAANRNLRIILPIEVCHEASELRQTVCTLLHPASL